jgi:hypothetical protein
MASTFVRSNIIQAALIALLKSKATLTSALEDPNEIRENSWKGTDFSYPAVRVDLVGNKPSDPHCSQSFTFTVQVYSEAQDSLQADEIAGIIVDILQAKQFKQDTLNLAFIVTNVRPAYPVGETIWRSDVVVNGLVS